MLHVRCGDDILAKLKEADLPGEMIRWADALCQGPTPGGLKPDQWRRIRAQHASHFYGIPYEQSIEFLRSQDENLQQFQDHEEIVLWFEHDLFDQIVLIYLLDWFSRQDLSHTTLLLICPDRHIGNMSVQELAQLYPTRRPVTAEQLALASRAWQAFCAPDPSAQETLLREDTSALPHVAPAFKRHHQEFPSTQNGLGRTEQAALERIAAGIHEPVRLFREVQEKEERFWMGDSMFWPYLRELADGASPLLCIEGSSPWSSFGHPLSDRRLRLTDIGEAVLAQQKDRIALNGLDRWFGGVHVQGQRSHWRWDNKDKTLRGEA